uniref:G-protein coupled receptors family 1 profile domain-containing protein n=1 Tax=Sus scrofa TaxID=9823 RepID=A0A8D2BEI0_PIG
MDPSLPAANQTVLVSEPGPFVLMGVPGMESLQVWLSLPMCLLYMAALEGNVLLLGLVAADKALQAPMYQLLGLLAAAHLVLATSTVPKAQAVLWGLSGEISFGACLAQLFVAHVAFIAESSVLLAMAVDRYVAIRQPLRYRALLTQCVVGIVAAVAAVTRDDCVVAPPVALLQRLSYCGRRAPGPNQGIRILSFLSAPSSQNQRSGEAAPNGGVLLDGTLSENSAFAEGIRQEALGRCHSRNKVEHRAGR